MITQPHTDQSRTVTCSRCGKPILHGGGRYHVFPGESYCSWTCLYHTMPHIAEAVACFVTEPRSLDDSQQPLRFAGRAPHSAAPTRSVPEVGCAVGTAGMMKK